MKKVLLVGLLVPFFAFSKMVKVGDWGVSTDTDPITDKETVSIMVIEKEKTIDTASSLIFQCDKIILLPMPLSNLQQTGNNDNQDNFIFRVDKNKPIEMKWFIDQYYYSYSNLDEFKNFIESGKKLAVRVLSPQSTKDYIFSLMGFKKAYSQLANNCKGG